MPILYVLAGANGVGKTTWYQTGLDNGSVDVTIPFINIDIIIQKELGGYNDVNLAKAEQIARERMSILIGERRDFMIESNLSKSADYDWIARMRKNGYESVLYFLGTGDVDLNKIRVKERVHEV